MVTDPQGTIWGADIFRQGVFRVRQGELAEYADDTFPVNSIVDSLLADSQGRVWIGTQTRGLVRYANETFHHYSEANGAIEAKVKGLFLDNDDTLWLATGGKGLIRVREGQFRAFTTQQGLPTNDLNTVVDDQLGNLWFGSYNGIHRVAKQQLAEVAAGRANFVFAHSFGLADGLSTLQCSSGQPASIRAHDGRLWFATVKGINIVDPATIPLNQSPPKVILETLLLDGTPRNLHFNKDQESASEFSSAVERIEFRFTAISFSNPESIRFRYRLEPSQTRWNELGPNRSVVLPKLSPGQYRFRVTAANSDGVWNDVGQAFEFQVVGQWWERSDMRAFFFLTFLGIAFLTLHLRSRQLRRRQAAKEQFTRDLIEHQEADRQRIARELHDGLEQNLLVIKNQAAQIQTETSSKTNQQLQGISELSSQSIAEVRQIANNLRPYQIDRLGLTKAIQGMLDQLNQVTSLSVEHEIESVPSQLPSETQINLYRIIQEALNNTLKHAQATHATVTLIVTKRTLSLRIKDNGLGFDPRSLDAESGHNFGVSGIVERTELLGGDHELKSSPGFGTEWRIRLPL